MESHRSTNHCFLCNELWEFHLLMDKRGSKKKFLRGVRHIYKVNFRKIRRFNNDHEGVPEQFLVFLPIWLNLWESWTAILWIANHLFTRSRNFWGKWWVGMALYHCPDADGLAVTQDYRTNISLTFEGLAWVLQISQDRLVASFGMQDEFLCPAILRMPLCFLVSGRVLKLFWRSTWTDRPNCTELSISPVTWLLQNLMLSNHKDMWNVLHKIN